MLKPFSQPRQSPALSPRFHYAPASRSTPTSPSSSRRVSKSTPQIKYPPSRALNPVQYVDAGTQWSPIMSGKQDNEPGPQGPQENEVQLKELTVSEGKNATPLEEPPPPPPPEPILEGESPGIKRRQSRVDSSSTSTTQALPTKRIKSDTKDVKILPVKYEFCEVEDMVVLIANMIAELIQTNDSLSIKTGVLTRFHSRTPPGISVRDYLARLAKHATLTPPLLLSMVYYIDRLCLLYPAFTVNTLTVHRFLITAATVAAKGLSDSFWNNATYAKVGGIKLAELGLLELDFLYRVDWKIVPNPEALEDYYKWLVERSTGYEIESEEESSSSTEDEDDDENENEADDGIAVVDENTTPSSKEETNELSTPLETK